METVECHICHQAKRRIAPGHLRHQHNMTTTEYRHRFPDAPFVTETWRREHAEKMKLQKLSPNARKPRRGFIRNCSFCEKPFYVKPSLALNLTKTRKGLGKFCSMACQRKGRIITWSHLPRMYGPENPMWRGGYEPYYGPNWPQQRNRARKRDRYTCQQCGQTEHQSGKQHDVNHVRPFRDFGREKYQEANRLYNLVTLCHQCHSKVTNGSLPSPIPPLVASEIREESCQPPDRSE